MATDCSHRALVGDVYCVYCIFVTFPCGILGQVWYLIVSFPDLCRLSYFYNGENLVNPLASLLLIGSSTYLQVTRTTIKSRMGSKFSKIRPGSVELAALEHLEKSPYTYNGRNVVNTLVLSFFNGSSSFLQVTRPTIKAWMKQDSVTDLKAFSKFYH